MNDSSLFLKAMDMLLKHPLSILFQDPIDKEDTQFPDYYQKIQNPISLSQIRDNIKNGKYQDTSDWEKDVNLVWDNARKYHGNNSMIGQSAREMKNQFNKILFELFKESTAENWYSKIKNITSKFPDLLSKSPQKWSSINKGFDPSREFRKNNQIQQERFDNFMKAVKLVQCEKILKTISVIIITYEPNPTTIGLEDSHVDISHLSISTFQELEKYMKKEFANRGIPYPE